MSPPASALSQSHAYCRQARHLRGVYAGRPGELYRSLRQLSDRDDFARGGRRLEPVASNGPPFSGLQSETGQPSRMNEFACEVARRIEGSILRHSERKALLRRAESLGIGRVDANLAIASVQHQLGQLHFTSARPKPRSKGWMTFLIFLAIESLIALTLWAVFVR